MPQMSFIYEAVICKYFRDNHKKYFIDFFLNIKELMKINFQIIFTINNFFYISA